MMAIAGRKARAGVNSFRIQLPSISRQPMMHPTLTAFASAVASGNEDSQITVTFANLQTQGDEADVDGTVTAL